MALYQLTTCNRIIFYNSVTNKLVSQVSTFYLEQLKLNVFLSHSLKTHQNLFHINVTLNLRNKNRVIKNSQSLEMLRVMYYVFSIWFTVSDSDDKYPTFIQHYLLCVYYEFVMWFHQCLLYNMLWVQSFTMFTRFVFLFGKDLTQQTRLFPSRVIWFSLVAVLENCKNHSTI